ncbi:restriction endonuclease subunit S [Pseudactinotalea sp. Z1748]|uniref:restriction endonuclease subunit S n=1 Tax=Pseudactinotalea sp. Z1748 TaxID=3413027 RepID=UPI003C7D9118
MTYWLGSLPNGWRVRSLQYLCNIETGERDTADAVEAGALPFYIRSQTVHRIDSATHEGEAILTPGDGAVGEIFHHHRCGPFAAHQRVYVLRNFHPEVLPRFLYFVFSATFRNVTQQGTAKSTVDSLRRPMLTSFPVPLPPPVDQERIANYLDRETAEIDAMDAELDRLLETLRERRTAFTESLTAGRFETGRLIPLWSILAPVKDQGHPAEDVLSVYRDFGVIPKDSREDNFNRTPENLMRYQLVRPRDLVVNKMKAWQGSLGISSHRGIVSPDYQVCRPVGVEVDPQYLHVVLRSPQMIPQYRVRSKGVRPSQWRLYWEDMAPLMIPVPDIAEQRRIVGELNGQTTRIDGMVADARRLKGLLVERRSTLITEVVTGAKEVPA